MKYKRRKPKEKARIVLEYLTTHNTAEICNKYDIYPHSALNYKIPLQFEEDYYKVAREQELETQQIFI